MNLHIMFAVLSTFVMLIILASSLKYQRDEGQRKAFIYTILASIFTTVSAEFFEIGKNGFIVYSPAAIKVISSAVFIGSLCMCNSWYVFVNNQTRVPLFQKSAVKNTAALLFFLVLVLDVSSIWTGSVFKVSDEGVFSKGILRFLSVAGSSAFMVLAIIEILIKIHTTTVHRHVYRYLFLGMFTLLPLFSQGLFVLLKMKAGIDLPFQCFGSTIAVVFGYIYILENNRERERQKLFDITNALSLDYGSVFYVNTVNNTIQIMRLDDFVKTNCLRILEMNGRYDEVIRYCSESLIYIEDRVSFNNYLHISNVRKLLEEQDSYSFDFRGNMTSAYKFLRIKLIKTDTEVDHFIIGLKDISGEVEKQQQYHEDLQNALVEAQTANKAKSVFLSNMSHDIRTPMNAIIGFTDMARDSLNDPVKLEDCLNKISSSSNHLLSLINDVLDMSRIENGKMNLENSEVNLNSVLDDIRNIISPQISSKNLDFEMIVNNLVHENLYMDSLRVKQVLLNVLSNSMKFTQIGGKILFEISERHSNNPEMASFHFVVSDNGCGMSKEFLKRVFEPFARERTTTDSGISGTGLGMTIVKSLVQQLQGSITVNSLEGEGTTFNIDLMFRICTGENRNREKTVSEKENFDLTGIRVLLVEDNELNREIARNILNKFHAEVTELVNCRQAVDLVIQSREKLFDIILMDIQTPFMNGYDATKAIRKLENNPMQNIPIIAMTANAFEEDKKAALEAGMNDHVAKPIRVKTLMNSIVNAIAGLRQ